LRSMGGLRGFALSLAAPRGARQSEKAAAA
jgi:hypothetical protein